LTKQHRASVTREKTQSQGSSKTKRSAEEAGSSSKRARTEEVVKSSILPAGFFSGGSGPTIVADEDDEEEEEETPVQAPVQAQVEAGPSTVKAPAPTNTTSTTLANGQTGDEELDSFLASLAEPDPENETNETEPAPTAATQKASTSKKSTYRDIIPGQASYEAAPIRNIPKDQDPEPEPEVQETEAEKRARLAREEREEIMDRLEEEERAQ
jgi:zinc finger protein 830